MTRPHWRQIVAVPRRQNVNILSPVWTRLNTSHMNLELYQSPIIFTWHPYGQYIRMNENYAAFLFPQTYEISNKDSTGLYNIRKYLGNTVMDKCTGWTKKVSMFIVALTLSIANRLFRAYTLYETCNWRIYT